MSLLTVISLEMLLPRYMKCCLSLRMIPSMLMLEVGRLLMGVDDPAFLSF